MSSNRRKFEFRQCREESVEIKIEPERIRMLKLYDLAQNELNDKA